MSKELRYLLHGNKEKYDDVQTSLYIASQDSTLWQKIGLQVLTSRKEAWRLIDSVFIDSIPTVNFQRLGIEKLLAEQVVDLIRPNPESVDGSLLNKSERDELLSYISQKPSNEELWKLLRLHENANNPNCLERIEVNRVYLENSDFPLDERLKNYIVLIRRNTEIQQNWIPSWTPDAAIAKVLSLPNPHQYYDIILDALQRMTNNENKELYRESLKSSGWLPPNGYCPQDILRLPNSIKRYEDTIASLDSTKYPENKLPKSLFSADQYTWVQKLFDFWNEDNVVKKVLAHNQRTPEYWSHFREVILDALPHISNDLKESLKTESWLALNGDGGTISPSRIINIIPEKLQKYLSTLVDLSGGEYTERQLSLEITRHTNFPILRKVFSKWDENDILEYIFNQTEPHQNYRIILDVFSNLWSQQPQKLPNANNQGKLKTKAWLATEQKNKAVHPENVLHYQDLSQEIEDLLLLPTVFSGYISSSDLAPTIRHSDCWKWLTKEVFITEDKALTEIGQLLKQAPEYQIGEFSVEEFPLDKCLEAFNQFDVSFLPAWNFANNLSKEKFQRYLLPHLLDKMEVAKLRELLKLLSNPAPQVDAANAANVEIFNTYLGLAINYGTFSTDILPHIHLLNRKGQWKSPKKLIKEGNNIDDTYVLDEKQLKIIHSFLKSETQGNHDLPESDEALEDKNSILINYFKKWESYCPLEPIGAFLSLFKSSDNKIKEQAEFYLSQRNIEILQARLLENTAKPIRVFQVHMGQAGNRMWKVTSILGCTFEAELANLANPLNFFVNEGELARNTIQLELLHIQPEQLARTELVRILKDSTKVLLKKVYGVEPNSIEAIWEDLLNSDQLDIQVAENYLIESAPYVLRTLGIKDDRSLPTRLILALLKDLDDLRHQKAEYKQQGLEKEQQDTEKAVQEKLSKLSNLLKEDEDVKNILLNSVRTKIRQHGYRLQSIPFELFQNADDAVVEWQEMSSPKAIEEERKQFVVVLSDRQLLFIHAGRPIGCFQHSDNPQRKYRNEGYHRDLEKMLAFNISDKGVGVTGMFGLGFKSVYLSSCKRPRILSKRLGFAVEGGLLPSRLSPEETTALKEKLKSYKMPSDATIVELELDQGIQPSSQQIITDFQELAGILTVFSRAITTYRFINDIEDNDSKLFIWERKPFLGIQCVEVNKITIKGEDSLRLCLRTASGSALLLDMTEKDGRLSCTTPDAPTFWVTAPTQEKLSVGFILNAAFKVTTGRTKLDPTGNNPELADNIGKEFGGVLSRLLDKLCEANWEDVKVALGFSSIDSYSFWEFIWKELAVSWQKIDTNDERRDLISRILGGDRGMGYLITRSKSLPNGLYGQYRQLISLHSDINYFKVTGKLAESSCFCEVSQWSHFQQNYQGNIISHTRWEEAKKLIGVKFEGKYTFTNLRLIDVLQKEIGTIEPKVTPEQAKQIGNLISKKILDTFSTSPEHPDLQSFLGNIRFNAQAGNDLLSEQLLSATSDQPEEKRLVGFAPDDRLLHSNYIASAIDFFYACRFRRDSVVIKVLVQWVLQAETTTKRNAVHHYLLHGDHRDELAKRLYENLASSWMANDRNIVETLELMVLIGIKREENYGVPPSDLSPNEPEFSEEEKDFQDHDPNSEIRTRCTSNDFSLSRSPADFEEFAEKLLAGIERQYSYWKGYIYHFTHVENAVSILQSEQLQSRNRCNKFVDSAGASLIHRTSNDVKHLARFYLRPKTPTQWHNEGLGKRNGQIYALCPVPIFFRLNLKRVLDTHGSKCGVSSGNLAASGSHYGNSMEFLEYFDFDNVYCTQAGRETFLRASQQEFVVHDYLDIAKLSLDDITIICRNDQDKKTLMCLIGPNSKYASRVFTEKEEAANCRDLFHHENPFVEVKHNAGFIEAKIENYDDFKIEGELILSFVKANSLEGKISSKDNARSRICIQLQSNPNTPIMVYFQEREKTWLIYTNESRNY
jgi:ssDNA thymidine ADP-ribosyltransferase, DarT